MRGRREKKRKAALNGKVSVMRPPHPGTVLHHPAWERRTITYSNVSSAPAAPATQYSSLAHGSDAELWTAHKFRCVYPHDARRRCHVNARLPPPEFLSVCLYVARRNQLLPRDARVQRGICNGPVSRLTSRYLLKRLNGSSADGALGHHGQRRP